MESTKSSCSLNGNDAHSSISSSAKPMSGAQTIPASNIGATECILVTLSLPRDGRKLITGIPIILSS